MAKFIQIKNKFTLARENHLTNIRSKLRDTITLNDFSEIIKDLWDTKFYNIMEDFTTTLYNSLEHAYYFQEQTFNIRKKEDKYFESQENSFKLINLAIMMRIIGCNFLIRSKILFLDSNEIKSNAQVNKSNLYTRIKEFEVAFKRQFIIDNPLIKTDHPKDITTNTQIYQRYHCATDLSEIDSNEEDDDEYDQLK